MKRLVVVMLAVMMLASMATANCGSCAKDKKAAATVTCPVASSLGELDLTVDQKTQVDAICKACQAECKKEGCCRSCQKKIKKVLTKEQSAKFNELVEIFAKAKL